MLSPKLSHTELETLPDPVQRWLRRTGVTGTSFPNKISLEQELLIRLKPRQTSWYKGRARQHYTVDPPSFDWTMRLKMTPGIWINGRDRFREGKGSMHIKMFSLIPLAHISDHPKLNQAALQRYLAEIIWFPHAALSKTIEWQQLDDLSAEATITVNGVQGTGTFYFNRNGDFNRFTALRYKDINENSEPEPWRIRAHRTSPINGILLPVECSVSWKFDAGEWTWLKVKLTKLEYV